MHTLLSTAQTCPFHRIVALAVLLHLVLSAGWGAEPAAHPRELFRPVPATEVQRAAQRRGVVRDRAVKPDFALVRTWQPGAAHALRLALFDGETLDVALAHQETGYQGAQTFFGQPASDPSGEVHLVLHRDVLVGVVHLPARNKVLRLGFVAGEVHWLAEVDAARCGGCAVTPRRAGVLAEAALAPAAAPPAPVPALCPDDGSVLDVLILYTTAARAAAGGTTAVEAEALLAVNKANTAYGASQVVPRLRLVASEETAYDENGTFAGHLDRLTSRTDGVMDDAHDWRDLLGADLVTLLVEDADAGEPDGALCGIGWQMRSLAPSFASAAFSVVHRGCAAAGHTFAHELGHNMGCNHDRANGGPGLFSYSAGWRFTGNDGREYRTVMAYEPGQRIGHFSNPAVFYQGQPTGVAVGQPNEANNALTLNQTTATVANFRKSVTWADFTTVGFGVGVFDHPFQTAASAVSGTPACGILRIKTSSRAEPVTFNRPMRVEAHGGPVTIGR